MVNNIKKYEYIFEKKWHSRLWVKWLYLVNRRLRTRIGITRNFDMYRMR